MKLHKLYKLRQFISMEIAHGETSFKIKDQYFKTIVWLVYDPDSLTITLKDYDSLQEGQWLANTIVHFYLKFLEKKHKSISGLYFFNNFSSGS